MSDTNVMLWELYWSLSSPLQLQIFLVAILVGGIGISIGRWATDYKNNALRLKNSTLNIEIEDLQDRLSITQGKSTDLDKKITKLERERDLEKRRYSELMDSFKEQVMSIWQDQKKLSDRLWHTSNFDRDELVGQSQRVESSIRQSVSKTYQWTQEDIPRLYSTQVIDDYDKSRLEQELPERNS